MRKLMLPPFHGEAIARYAELIEEITNREIDGWRPGRQDPHPHGRPDDHDGGDHPGGLRHHRPGAGRRAQAAAAAPVVDQPAPRLECVRKDLGPRSPWGRFLRDRDRVDEMLYEEIERRRRDADGEPGDDILDAAALRARRGRRAAHRPELRDELITLLLAGHETTATSIGWAFERLLRTPHALERLTAEVRAGEHATTSTR